MVPSAGLSRTDIERIGQAMKEKVGDGLGLELKTVEEISLTLRGKGKFLAQELPAEDMPASLRRQGRDTERDEGAEQP